jgi:hypothetical protein
VIIGVLIAFIDGIAIVGIAVFMFPILKKHNEPIALGYVGFRIVEFAIIKGFNSSAIDSGSAKVDTKKV